MSGPCSPRQEADSAQRRAADPAASAFVLASAGSGKTKLLVDRMLRLLLDGADPARLLCLTYTRAAAAEMAIRLRRRLGEWVRASEGELGERLRTLGVADTPELRARARGLFAAVLDVPGGLRIDTIHAFCQSVLRRFPLEAGLSPHFTVIEESERRELLEEALEEVLTRAVEGPGDARAPLAAAIERLAPHCEKDQIIALLSALLDERERYRDILALTPEERREILHRGLGLRLTQEAEFWDEALALLEGLGETLRRLSDSSEATDKQKEKFDRLLTWVGRPEAERRARFEEWCGLLLNKERKPDGNLLKRSTRLAKALPEEAGALREAQERLAALLTARDALEETEVALAFLELAAPVLAHFENEKNRAGFLDFGDLIARTAALLRSHPAAWVLYKLDGGIDHILIDEAQDTAPAQWKIIEALSEEFFAGETARSSTRTLFVVGDVKQSIYSFQGAKPEALLPLRHRWEERARGGGAEWRNVPLNVSFRTTAPLLDLVDRVFAGRAPALGLDANDAIRHASAREERAARIELWPLLGKKKSEGGNPAGAEAEDAAAADEPPRDDPPAPETVLAEALARWIKSCLDDDSLRLPASGRRPVAGDFLVLVRRRGRFDAELVRALKRAGVNVAGRDRLLLTEQPAVADLLNLCDAILLPEDDLALANFLVSPLGGLDQESLMELALGRSDSLWQTLLRRRGERKAWNAAADFLETLRDRQDFTSPYGLLAEALSRFGGRRRLLARFGEEALEPIEELLAEARRYAEIHPPSLEGFVHWLRVSAEEIKRAPENLADAVRIMTVHGAKGLEAPCVILPDTTFDPARIGRGHEEILTLERGGALPCDIPFFHRRPTLDFGAAVAAARERKEREGLAEHHRLLYVALTRAQEWLVVCGVEKGQKKGAAAQTATDPASGPNPAAAEGEAGEGREREEEARSSPSLCWYDLIRQGMAGLEGVEEIPWTKQATKGFAWSGTALRFLREERRDVPTPSAAPLSPPDLPPFARDPAAHPPPPEPSPLPRLTPAAPAAAAPRSPLEGRAGPRAAALERGRLVHALLAQLPTLAEAEREGRALAFLAANGLAGAAAAEIWGQVAALLADPACARFFGPEARAEVAVAGSVAGFEVNGVIDRLVITPEVVWLADFKTDADPPPPGKAPPSYLRQLALYAALLAELYPGREVRAAIIWTALPRIDGLAKEALDAALPSGPA